MGCVDDAAVTGVPPRQVVCMQVQPALCVVRSHTASAEHMAEPTAKTLAEHLAEPVQEHPVHHADQGPLMQAGGAAGVGWGMQGRSGLGIWNG